MFCFLSIALIALHNIHSILTRVLKIEMSCHEISTPDKQKQNAELGAQEDQLEARYIVISVSNKAAAGSTFAFKVIEFHYKTVTNMEQSSLRSFKALSVKQMILQFYFFFPRLHISYTFSAIFDLSVS